jgi:hypothetical protein
MLKTCLPLMVTEQQKKLYCADGQSCELFIESLSVRTDAVRFAALLCHGGFAAAGRSISSLNAAMQTGALLPHIRRVQTLASTRSSQSDQLVSPNSAADVLEFSLRLVSFAFFPAAVRPDNTGYL